MHMLAHWMTLIALTLLAVATDDAASMPPSPWTAHIERADASEDPLAGKAARFLAKHAPPRDAEIDVELLDENLELTLRARTEFAWSSDVPEEVFLNDVLPYASLDETRERWRPALYAISRQIVSEAMSSGEAAQLLNDRFFDVVGVHYNTGRKRANQSAFESMKQGRATCTGLSILLVNACRSVGVPARLAGVAEWVSTPGNHTWVEVWDGDAWRFAGADEHDPEGLDRGWFVGRASEAVAGSARHGVWATSWRKTETHFPMAWSPGDTSVSGVDVTHRYAPTMETPVEDAGFVTRFFRVWDRTGGDRIEARLRVFSADRAVDETISTRAGRADLNDMPSVRLEPGSRVYADVTTENAAMRVALDIDQEATGVIDLDLERLALSADDADAALRGTTSAMRDALLEERADEHAKMSVALGEHTLRYLTKLFGADQPGTRPLWISLHGGGGAPPEVNDRQWENQIRLYEPTEGLYLAPRAPTNTWNLWHQAHVDDLLDRLIENLVLFEGVDPDRVYLMGYSAGGDGVYQLAPRMADRFAAASMMAGHPNEAQPLGLRNLPFAIFMGGEDSAYDRNKIAQQWGESLAALREQDPSGYEHRVTIYPGLGHWMDGRDAEVLPWMLERRRDAWPDRVVWYQDDVVSHRFYWLGVRPGDAVRGQIVTARVRGQTIEIEAGEDTAPARITLRLSDALVDLDKPVMVLVNGEAAFEGRVLRTRGAIEAALEERFDPRSAGTAVIEIELR